MGQNWRTNYDRYLHIINPSAIYGVVAERPDGQVISFTSNSGTYTPDSDVDLKLDRFRQHMDADRPERQCRNLFYERQRRRSAIHHAAEQIHAGPHLFARPDCFRVGFLQPETDLRLFVRVAFDRVHAGIYSGLTYSYVNFHEHRQQSAHNRHLHHQPGDASNLPV